MAFSRVRTPQKVVRKTELEAREKRFAAQLACRAREEFRDVERKVGRNTGGPLGSATTWLRW